MKAKITTIDEYLDQVTVEQRATLQKLRQMIQTAAPEAEECISYGLAAFRLNGKALVGFGATAKHCAFYPMSSSTITNFQKELENYETSKGTIRFPANKLLPATLVRKLVNARIAEIQQTTGAPPKPTSRQKSSAKQEQKAVQHSVTDVLAELEQLGSKSIRETIGPRYGIHTERAFGISVSTLHQIAKRLGRNHELSEALWESGWYEARLLAVFIDEPSRVTPAQMDRWGRDFDNWAICDTACFHLFDRTPHAWRKVESWAARKGEFVKRAAFALMASLALHDKKAADEQFLRFLPLIEAESTDARNFVKKAVNWALRGIGKRNAQLKTAAIDVAQRLAESENATARWVGKDALRELTRVKKPKS